jgi:hypothetical protein
MSRNIIYVLIYHRHTFLDLILEQVVRIEPLNFRGLMYLYVIEFGVMLPRTKV